MAFALMVQAGIAAAADVHVMYPPPMRTVLVELLPRFERRHRPPRRRDP